MTRDERISLALLALRLSVFLVMLMWTLDKLLNPAHAGKVFAGFYGISGLGSTVFGGIAVLELALIVAFLVGFQKRLTYGAVLLLHAVSTLSSYHQYFDPWKNLLFFAAWPMLAACFALYLLRDMDTRMTLG